MKNGCFKDILASSIMIRELHDGVAVGVGLRGRSRLIREVVSVTERAIHPEALHCVRSRR